MKKIILPITAFALLVLAGCQTVPVADSGSMGSVTVSNTNPTAIIAAAKKVFAGYGYAAGPAKYPASISFDKIASTYGKLMWGGYDESTMIRVRLNLVQVPGTNNYVLSTRLSHVTDAGEAGFESSSKMSSLWSSQFEPILKQIKARASGAGPR